MPTLSRMPKHIPILAQPEAAERIAPLGFSKLSSISPGQCVDVCDGHLHVCATPGALVGPPWSQRQNGYVLTENGVQDAVSLYYEPHCDFDPKGLEGLAPVDVVVSPAQSVLLGGYPLLKGHTDLAQVSWRMRCMHMPVNSACDAH